MTEEYIGGVVSLERECFSHPWSEKSLREELDNDQAHFLCAVADGFIAGYIGVQEIVGEAYITNVAVAEKFRRRGIAEKLLEEAERGAMDSIKNAASKKSEQERIFIPIRARMRR